MRHHRCVSAAALAVAGALAVTACSSGGGGVTAATPAGSVSAEAAPAGGEKGGGEKSVPFTNPTLGWSIAAPGAMTAQGGDGSYTGTSDRLVVTALAGGDPQALAAADAAGTGVAGFALVQPPHPVAISGVNASALEYNRADAVNPVTKKAQTAHVVRAYVPGSGKLFRLEYGATVPAADWDPQGAIDILSTFRSGK